MSNSSSSSSTSSSTSPSSILTSQDISLVPPTAWYPPLLGSTTETRTMTTTPSSSERRHSSTGTIIRDYTSTSTEATSNVRALDRNSSHSTQQQHFYRHQQQQQQFNDTALKKQQQETSTTKNTLPQRDPREIAFQQQQKATTLQQQPSSFWTPTTSFVAIETCPYDPNSFATINLYDEDWNYKVKHGAMLCQLHRLQFHPVNINRRIEGRLWQTKLQQVSRLSPHLGPSMTATCLAWSSTSSISNKSHILATGLSTGNLCLHSFPHDSSSSLPTQEQFSIRGNSKRFATAVAFRPNHPHHVALGLSTGTSISGLPNSSASTLSSSPSTVANVSNYQSITAGISPPATTMGTTNNNMNSINQSHAQATHGSRNKSRDTGFGCLVWDVSQSVSSTSTTATNTSHLTPWLKVCHNSTVTSLAWMHHGQTLAVSCPLRPLQLYDLRVSSSPQNTVLYEAESVRGMKCRGGGNDNDQILATYTERGTVKLWDLRQSEDPVFTWNVDPSITAIEWSRPGVLSIAIHNRVLHYDVTQKPTLLDQTHVPLPILDMTMVPNQQERFLVVLQDKSVRDVSLHTHAPVAISKRDGHILHGFQNHIWKATGVLPQSDISLVMKRRASCDQPERYSIDASSNIRIILKDSPLEEGNLTNKSLVNLWRWIDRLETKPPENLNPANALTDGGVLNLLQMMDSTAETDREDILHNTTSLPLGCYDSSDPARIAALGACGWTSIADFSAESPFWVDCQQQRGEYERAAALAIWHDNLALAVQALDDGSQAPNCQNPMLLQIVSIGIAGYSRNNTTKVWESACSRLRTRTDLQQGETGDIKNPGIPYLDAMLRFLSARNASEQLNCILQDSKISLLDRIGFACRFLRRSELQSQLRQWVESFQQDGNLEGLLITGLTPDGIKILQAYVDQTGDIQTATLVTCRVPFPDSWTIERRVCSEWLDSYRNLLNTWQMWESRSMLDVDRAERLRRLQATIAISKTTGATRMYSSKDAAASKSKTGNKPKSKQLDPDFILATSIPGQMDVRCNYCSVSLLRSRKQDGATSNQWLASQSKSVLSCCPRCRKPLPRCSICLLPLGCLNPQKELHNRGVVMVDSTTGGGSGNSVTSSHSSSKTTILGGSLPFAEWFTWCMRCKHGGHAHHLVGWFANHDTCPVSGCDCKCQLDGIKKLKSVALKKIENKE